MNMRRLLPLVGVEVEPKAADAKNSWHNSRYKNNGLRSVYGAPLGIGLSIDRNSSTAENGASFAPGVGYVQ
jgi:hypothetical protein